MERRGDSPVTSKNSPLKHLHRLSPGALPKQLSERGRTAHFPGTSAAALRQKELRELDTRLRDVSKNYDKLESKYSEAAEKLKTTRQKSTVLEKDLTACRNVISRLTEDKAELESKLAQNKDYIRKLETTITMGTKGQMFSEVHDKLTQDVQACRDQITKLNDELEAAHAESRAKDQEIGNLHAALSVRLDEFKLKGDTRGGILYELGEARHRSEQQADETRRVGEELRAVKKAVLCYGNDREGSWMRRN